MFKRYERAQKWLHEQNPDHRKPDKEYEEGELPSMDDLRREALEEEKNLEKGDWFAMLFAAFFTILVPCLLLLLFIVGVAFLIF